jgi:hypothetical protein
VSEEEAAAAAAAAVVESVRGVAGGSVDGIGGG